MKVFQSYTAPIKVKESKEKFLSEDIQISQRPFIKGEKTDKILIEVDHLPELIKALRVVAKKMNGG